MILADTSIWIDHLRAGDAALEQRLVAGVIVCHPYVVGEIALGSLRARVAVLGLLDGLPSLPLATAPELRALVEQRALYGKGIGYVDVALVASCLLCPGATLWTRDRRLAAIAETLAINPPRER